MKLLPRTLFGQLLAVLLIGLVAVQALGLSLVLDDRARMAERLLGSHAAQRIAGIITILDQADPDERERLMRSLNVPPTNLSLGETWGNAAAESSVYKSTFGRLLTQEPWRTPNENGARDANAFITLIAKALPDTIEVRVLSIKWWEPGPRHGPPPEPGLGDRNEVTNSPPPTAQPKSPQRSPRSRALLSVVGQARLTDGNVLTFRHSMPEQSIDWPLRLLGWLMLLAIGAALLSIWAVRRLTRPLSTLSDAATGLARNLEQPPLPETGPQEIARAAIAFNAMQKDLKRLIYTRAQTLAGVSHDLRLPITRLRLRIDSLADETLRCKIESDLAEMEHMIGNTLEYLRVGTGIEKKVRVDLDALLESLAEDVHAMGATVTIHGKIGHPYLGRPMALRRCLGNLLDNARRYGGSVIDIHVTQTSTSEVKIEISDCGPGIPEDDLEKVCEPYVRLESSRARHTGGTGLGLAIARSIADSHGGTLKLSRRTKGGLTVCLSLTGEFA